jgi:hypothetical protein
MYDHDMFGLDEAGSRNHYLIGGAAGVAISTGTAVMIRKYSTSKDMQSYANGIGAVTAGVIGGALTFMPKTKEAGIALAVSGVAAGLLGHVAEMLMDSATKPATKPEPAPAPGQFGYGYGFGAPVIDAAYPIPGSVQSGSYGFGAARPELVGPPTLVGAGDYGMSENAGATQTRLLGGPSISALGSHYGATLFGR